MSKVKQYDPARRRKIISNATDIVQPHLDDFELPLASLANGTTFADGGEGSTDNNTELASFYVQSRDYDYIAWVPCICGRLNYKNASHKTALGDVERARSVNTQILPGDMSKGDFIRALAVSSTVDWRDRKDDSYNGKFKVIVAGDTDSYHQHSFFRLRVGIIGGEFVDTHFSKEMRLFNGLYRLDAVRKKLKSTEENKQKIERNQRQLTEAYNQLYDSLGIFPQIGSTIVGPKEQSKSYYLVEALLHPNGLIACRYIDDEIRDTNLTGAELDAYKISKAIIVRQAFYYLKYIFHQHKHHPVKDDSVCTIIPRAAFKPAAGDGDKHIGPAVVGNMIQVLTQFRRHADKFNSPDLHHKGLIGYARSLAKSCNRVGFYTQQAYEHQLLRLEYVEQSFSAMVEISKEKAPRQMQCLSLALQMLMIMVVLIGTYHLIGKPGVPGAVDAQEGARVLGAMQLDYFIQAGLYAPLVVFCAFVIFLQFRKYQNIDLLMIRNFYQTHTMLLLVAALVTVAAALTAAWAIAQLLEVSAILAGF